MHIKAFHIDAFGLLQNVTVEQLSPGLSIFLGHNEAGKSTCLDFFRTMLTGYPLRRSARERDYSVSSGQGGGTLSLQSPEGLVQLTRRPGKGSGIVSLTDASGNLLDVAVLDRLLGKITREVYRSIYGFSLSELQSLESLSSDEVRSALYGASFGMGLRSPTVALERLQKDKEELFKARGTKPVLSAALREWEELHREIRKAEDEAAHYDTLAGDLRAVENQLADLRAQRQSQSGLARAVDRRLGVWRQWEEWHLAGVRLGRLEAVSPTFPHDGIRRLEKAQEQEEQAAGQASRLAEQIERNRAAMAALCLDSSLCEAGAELKSLAERKASFRNALAALPGLEYALERTGTELEALLGSLGTAWNLERIHQLDRSLFVREDLERQAGEMNTAATGHAAQLSAMDKATQDLTQALHERDIAQIRLETLPVPVAELEEAERELLRRSLARAEEAKERLPERGKALHLARAEFNRALAPLNLRPAHASLTALDHLASRQEDAASLAGQVLQADADYVNAQRLVEQAKEAEELVRQRLVRIEEERNRSGMPTRASIDSRRGMLRALRALAAEQGMEEDRLAELREAHNEHLAAKPVPARHLDRLAAGLVLVLAGFWLYMDLPLKLDVLGFAPEQRIPSWLGLPLLAGGALSLLFSIAEELRGRIMTLSGAVLSLAGGGAIFARRMAGFTELNLGSWRLPLELWPGYMSLLFGLLCLAWGLSRRKTELSPYERQSAEWQRRLDAQQSRLGHVATQTLALREQLGLVSLHSEELDSLESRLDAERELCATNDRLQQEINNHAEELQEARARTGKQEGVASAVRNQTQALRKRWHEYMQELGVQNVPLPEGAGAYFARVDSARLAWAGVVAVQDELAELEANIANLGQEAQRLVPAHAAPENWEAPEQVMEAVRRVLESCREADLIAEERARAAEALRGAEAVVARAESGRLEALQRVQSAEERLARARASWQTILANLGLDMELSPSTTREALECMDRCIALEAEQLRLGSELAAQQRERDALAKPFQALLARLGQQPDLTPGCFGDAAGPDWIVLLDAMLEKLEAAQAAREEHRQLERVCRDLEEEESLARISQTDARQRLAALLEMAAAPDAETFRRKAAVLAEREQLVRRRQDLEDALAMAAGTSQLAVFLEEFATLDKAELEQSAQSLAAELEACALHEQALSDTAGTLRARLAQLASSGRLAELRMEEAALAETLRLMGLEWSRLALAQHLLFESKRRFEEERQPEVVRMASELFATISQGEWQGVSASLEDSSLKVLRPHGEPVGPEYLSRGAQEQLYLALRVAGIRQHAAHANPLPVIMDDILVNFDPARAKRTAAILGELAQPQSAVPAHQVIYFTCHPHTAQRLQEAVPGAALYTIERGRIFAAD